MAEPTVTDTTTDRCCAPERQATCCEPSAKADCCGHGEGCRCDASSTTTSALADAGLTDIEIRETHLVHEQAALAIVRARKPTERPVTV